MVMTFPPLLAGFLFSCAPALLPADGAAVALEEATLEVAVVEIFVVAAAAGFEKVDVARDVEGPAANLKGNNFFF